MVNFQIFDAKTRSLNNYNKQIAKWDFVIQYSITRESISLKNHTQNEAGRLVRDLFLFSKKAWYEVKVERRLEIICPPHFHYGSSRKMFVMLYSINWLNFILWLSLLLEILSNMCIAIVCLEKQLHQNLYIFWTTWEIGIKFSGKKWLIIMSKVAKKQAFERIIRKYRFEKTIGEFSYLIATIVLTILLWFSSQQELSWWFTDTTFLSCIGESPQITFCVIISHTAQKMKFSIKDFFSKCKYSFLRIWSHLLKKSLMKKFIFCTVSFIRLDMQ